MISALAPMCHCVQYILTRSYQTQLSCASYYILVHLDKLLVTNTDNYTSILLNTKSGKYLTRAKSVASLHTALSAVGYDGRKFAGHSFRIGAATTAAQYGLEESLIKTLVRLESSAYTRYIRTPPQTVSKMLISGV